ncbi:MAG: SGNH/GDSL hydrolase family protein [Betaproteobacteria bacterium]|nr:SGNH/GDSL hydrolase family protein [Betaproteobacteria bacterium]
MRRVLAVAGGILFSLGLTLVGAEVALRAIGYEAPVWYRPDPVLGWGLRPGAKGWFDKEGRGYIQVSPAGFRDRTHDLAKPKGTYRIAVLGDSYAEAMQVDFKSTFWWQLQEKLSACVPPEVQVEVMNFGVSGYGTAQESELLERTAIRYQPDLVLLAFTNGNDLLNNSAALEPEKDRPFYRVGANGLSLDDSFARTDVFRKRSSPWLERFRAASDRLRLAQLVHEAKKRVEAIRAGAAHAADSAAPGASPSVPGAEPGTALAAFAPPRDAAWRDAWTVTEALISRMNAFSSSHGARFALVAISHGIQVTPDAELRRSAENALGVHDLFYIERRMEALGRREGFPVIALAPEMQRRATEDRVFLHGFRNVGLGIGHWNEEGHRMAAELIAKRLCNGIVPSAPRATQAAARAAVVQTATQKSYPPTLR